jgi:hypothetical protein
MVRYARGLAHSPRLIASALTVLTGAALALTGSAQAAFASVSPTPASGTPELATTGTTQQVRQIVQCGQTMYAVGSFTLIRRFSVTYPRNNIFSFSAAAPYKVTSWNPGVNGVINTIAFNGNNCSTAYIGGKFTSVHGTPATNIAAISTSTGAVQAGFAHNANRQVETLASSDSHLLVGGYFTSINGSSAHRYIASLNPTTGKADGFIYQYCNSSGTKCASSNNTRIYNQQISHGGSLDLVEGDFSSVGGQPRQQIFMLNLSGPAATVTAWTSSAFDDHCWFTEPFYVRAASWSPDDSTVYIATTGFHPADWNGAFPLTGLCDVAAAFPGSQAQVIATWINYTGCDSLYSTAADGATALLQRA